MGYSGHRGPACDSCVFVSRNSRQRNETMRTALSKRMLRKYLQTYENAKTIPTAAAVTPPTTIESLLWRFKILFHAVEEKRKNKPISLFLVWSSRSEHRNTNVNQPSIFISRLPKLEHLERVWKKLHLIG